MSAFNIEVDGGKTVKLPTAGKYCDRDIFVTAKGSGSGGYDEGYEAGQKAEYDMFWDRMQNYGNRTDFDQAFSMEIFPRDRFDPKYDMHITSASSMFRYWNHPSGLKIDLDLRGAGVEIDFSSCTEFTSTFHSSYDIVAIGTLDTRSANGLPTTFYYAQRLHTIEKLILKDDGSQTFSNTFTVCSALENITIEGTIGTAIGFSHSSKLSNASVQSIIDHLKDLTGQTAQKLTFHNTVGKALTEAQKAAITAKNWTLAY